MTNPVWKSVVKAIVGVVIVVVLFIAIKGLQIFKMVSAGGDGMPPTTVTSAEVKQENWAPLLSAIGSIAPVQGATISSELAGTVAQVGFESGTLRLGCRHPSLKRSHDSEEILEVLEETARPRLHLSTDGVSADGFAEAVPEEPVAI